MEINGLQIRDIKDIQDALTAFSTLNAELENLGDSMAENLGDYKSLTNNQKEILEAINALQINSNKAKDDLIGFANDLPIFIKDMNESFSLNSINVIKQIESSLENANTNIVKNFNSLKAKIDYLSNSNLEAIEEAIKSINFKHIEDSINVQIGNQEKVLTNNIKSLDKSIKGINNSAKNVEIVRENISVSLLRFNKASKSLTIWKSLILLLIGGIAGAGAMFTYGLPMIKPILKSNENVYNFFKDNSIIYGTGHFKNTKEPYLWIDGSNYKESSIYQDGKFVITFKK